MNEIIEIISNHYLIGEESLILLEDGNIEFTDNDSNISILSKKELINDYIDFLTDLLKDNRQSNDYNVCLSIIEHLKILYKGLIIVSLI